MAASKDVEDSKSSEETDVSHSPVYSIAKPESVFSKEQCSFSINTDSRSASETPELQQQSSREFCSRPATIEETRDLPHVMADIPITTWFLVFIGSAAAFARYGVTIPFQNYIQNPPGNPHLPGALDLGEEKATIITSAFLLLIFLTPLPMGILSDGWLGRYRTMNLSLGLLLLGYVLLVVTALPILLDHGAGLGGLIASMILISFGQGGLSAVMFAFIGDQIPETDLVLVQKAGNNLAVVDRKMTIQFVFNTYFWASNLASLSMIGTTFLERSSFWAAFLMPTGVLAISIVPVILWSSRLARPPLQENVLSQALQLLFIASRNGFQLSAADPGLYKNRHVSWTTSFIAELRRGLKVCQVMAILVVFWLCYNQMFNNIVSQAGQMELVGISNDTIVFLNIAAVVILGPIIQGLIDLLRRHRIPFGPIRRITVGFILTAAAMGYAAILQHLIYSRRPCYSYPLECPEALKDGHLQPNKIVVWLQAPIHILLGGGEILAYVSVTEYAYSEAPTNMKAIIQALSQLTVALGSALSIALAPVSKNPWLVKLYACSAGVMGASTLIFWLIFRRRDKLYQETSGVPDRKEQSEA